MSQFKMAANMAFKDSYKASVVAGLTTTTFYSGLTALFLGREMDGFDQIARLAVAAELGKKPEELAFSDYLQSENRVVKRRMDLFKQENAHRYPVSLMPMLPTAMENMTRSLAPQMKPEQSLLAKGETRWRDAMRPRPNASGLEHALHGWNLWDTVVYAGVATLWLLETFNTDKTFAYQGRKEMENNEALGLKIDPNNIAGLYNRMRSDTGLPMIDNKLDRDKIWPLFEALTKKVNENPNFGLPEIAYLMGLGKLDVFAKDAQGKEMHDDKGRLVIDEKVYTHAMQEIERVEKIGLKGIAEEKRKAREAGQGPVSEAEKSTSFIDKVGHKWLDAHLTGYRNIMGENRKFAESISPRDPGEVPLSLA